MITLYYIKGISAVDEPVFDTIVNQKLFFSGKIKFQFDTGFYPPHFKNEIIISTEDIAMRDSFNYLSLEYEDKTYYYFITDIEYISEDTLKLYVAMDTVQTYMFNCDFIRSEITRNSVKRWFKNGKINRNYIRTNRRKGTMEQTSLVYLTDDIGWYIIEITATTIYMGDSHSIPFQYVQSQTLWLGDSSLNKCNNSGGKFFIAVPIILNNAYDKIKYNNETIDTNLWYLSKINGVLSITYYNYNIFKDYVVFNYDKVTKIITITGTQDSTLGGVYIYKIWNYEDKDNYYSLGYMCIPHGLLNIYEDVKTRVIGFNATTSKTRYRTYAACPVMLDENYYQLEYGERSGVTSYPLHKLTTDIIDLHCIVNCIDGGRSFYISETDVNADYYNTLIINMTIEQLALYNDQWSTYLSQNQSTLMNGRSLAYDQIMYKVARSGVSAITSLASSYSMIGGMSGLNSGNATQIGMMSESGQAAGGLTVTLMDAMNDVMVYERTRQMQEENLQMAPDNQKVGNSCASDIVTGVLRPYLKISKCSDFDNVWQDYEENGYDVAEHTSENLFTYASNRYYYDVIRVNSSEITLLSHINDDTTISLIEDRFKKGLRLWHTTNGVLNASNIGDYTYDNVENILIS